MKKKKIDFFWLWMILFVLLIVGAFKHFRIKNFNVVEEDILYTSGQPRGMDYTRLLYKYHIATFINIRTPNEHREANWYNEEAQWMKESGVKYIEMPMNKNSTFRQVADSNDLQEFLKIMNDKTKLPVLIHDNTGRNRVPYMAAIWMAKSGKYDMQEIIKRTEHIKEVALTDEEKALLKKIASGH